MALKKVTHRVKVPTPEHIKVVSDLAFQNDASHIRLRCCESRYNDAVSKGDAALAVEEHRNRIFFAKEVRHAQNQLWDYVRSVMPEVPEPSPNTGHTIDVAAGCEVCWTTYEESVPAQPELNSIIQNGETIERIAGAKNEANRETVKA